MALRVSGLAIGKELARRGYDLLLVNNQEARLAEVKSEIENKYGVKVMCLLPGVTETGLYDPNRVNLKLAKRHGIIYWIHRKTNLVKKGNEALEG